MRQDETGRPGTGAADEIARVQAAYEEVAYPAMVCTAGHPDRLAVAARLHGLSPPPIETARVLEIGGGDGVNLMALACAYPHAQFLSVDLAPSAVARGRALVARTGLDNVRIEQGDIVRLADDMAGTFDYVIAHGVYAWVPDVVREAVMRLIGRVLAADGVAFVDYNAMPGGHLRQTLREMMLYRTRGIADPAERLRVAHEALVAFGAPREGERLFVEALREHARSTAKKTPAVLHHDELGAFFAPQMLSDVSAAAAANGLLFLNEADPLGQEDGFAPADEPDADSDAIVRIAQLRDFESMKFFRQSLFVRAAANPVRRPAVAAVAGLYAAAQCERVDAQVFTHDGGRISISDPVFAAALARLVAAWPARLPVAALALDEEQLTSLHELAGLRFVNLHSVPREGVAVAGERPVASPLARAQAEDGAEIVATLDHMMIAMNEAGPRRFLALLDGTRDHDEIAVAWATLGLPDGVKVEDALRKFALAALLVA
ncbi:class I SAM-dependent methyltransferase [Sphingomonas profundi]|uniref:class I SAM-dependent methyltransferase n=1 Tax=Alterirhizorhabdus profundi TaxID=2681549 RepID=UPI0012E88675|nr:class I SAM-dependent methyltransferase [Sphingomonas profundi]